MLVRIDPLKSFIAARSSLSSIGATTILTRRDTFYAHPTTPAISNTKTKETHEELSSNSPHHGGFYCRTMRLASRICRRDNGRRAWKQVPVLRHILTNRINGGSSQRGNFMLVISSQLLGNKKLDEIKPNIEAAK
jgi:hypothetical protein